jgi:hypothetical protein
MTEGEATMLDTTPITTAITRLISTGTTEQALLAAVTHLFPNLSRAEALAGVAGRYCCGGAEGLAPALKVECHVLRRYRSGDRPR